MRVSFLIVVALFPAISALAQEPAGADAVAVPAVPDEAFAAMKERQVVLERANGERIEARSSASPRPPPRCSSPTVP